MRYSNSGNGDGSLTFNEWLAWLGNGDESFNFDSNDKVRPEKTSGIDDASTTDFMDSSNSLGQVLSHAVAALKVYTMRSSLKIYLYINP